MTRDQWFRPPTTLYFIIIYMYVSSILQYCACAISYMYVVIMPLYVSLRVLHQARMSR